MIRLPGSSFAPLRKRLRDAGFEISRVSKGGQPTYLEMEWIGVDRKGKQIQA